MKPSPSISLINLTDPEERIVGSLERALTETGFVMAQGHGIPSELVLDVRRVVEGYFSRPAEYKIDSKVPGFTFSIQYPEKQ